MAEVALRRWTDRPVLKEPLLWIGIAIIAIAFVSSDGLFVIDELIYLLGTTSLVNHGSFVVQTGFSTFQSSGLKLIMLVDGPHGLVPQYPPGYAALTAPFVALLGARGFILVNALAAAAIVFVVRALARDLFLSGRAALIAPYLFLFATFSLEYAYGVWPQMLSAALAAGAVLCFARSLNRSGRETAYLSIAAGLLIGLGMTVRLDAIFLMPAFAVFHLIETRRPARPIALLLAGLLPAIALLCAANFIKFGTFNPLSYGKSGGSTDIRSYLSLIALLLPGALFLIAMRWCRSRNIPAIRVLAPSVVLVVLAGMTNLLGGAANHILSGVYALVIDITHIDKGDPAAVYNPDGTVLFFGIPKKALVQSMPWLGIAPLLFLEKDDRNRQRSMVLALLVCAFWIAPFAFRSWYGGIASNMRYLLPVVPILCVLIAAALDRLPLPADILNRKMLWAYVIGFLAALAAAFLTANGLARAQQIYTLYAFFGLLILSIAFVLPGLDKQKTNLGKAILLTFSACVGISSLWAAVDVATSQVIRHSAKEGDELLGRFPQPFLVFGRAERFPSVFAHYPSEVGSSLVADCRTGASSCATLDFALISRLMRRGYRILVYRPAISDRIRDEVRDHGFKLREGTGSAPIDDQFAEITR